MIGEDWKKEYYITGSCFWNKIILYDSNEKQYYLRHFAQTNIRGWDQKQLNESQTQGWYIDLSTLNAPAEFWDLLKKIILKEEKDKGIIHNDFEDPIPEEIPFWMNLNHIYRRQDFLDILKKQLTNTEKFSLFDP